MTRPPAAEVFRLASESIEVFTPPADVIVAEARAQRGRRRRTVVAGVAAAVLVLGGLTWLVSRESSGPEDLPPAKVTRARNPVPVAWYAEGRLHLERVAVTVPELTDLVELNGGAVYGDLEGTVAFVAADGERRRIGHKDPDQPLVASTGEGWAAWVDPGDGGQPMLMVYDVSKGAMLRTRDLTSADVRLIAIDQHRVFYETPVGSYAWTPGVEPPEELVRDGLADVESATRVYQVGGTIEMVQSFFNVSYVRPGVGARLSAGGSFVLSRVPGLDTADGSPFRPLLYDTRSGARMPSGVGVDERAVDATFGGNHTLVYLVAQVADIDDDTDPLLVLRSCDLDGTRCADVAPVESAPDRPLLAR